MADDDIERALQAVKHARLMLLQERTYVFDDSDRPRARVIALEHEYERPKIECVEMIADRIRARDSVVTVTTTGTHNQLTGHRPSIERRDR